MNKNSQNGNAIVMILIAVALFAALSLAFTNTSRTSSSFIGDEEAKAYANQIIAYGNDVKSAVKRLQLRGCSDTEISFENNIVTDYVNPNAPTDQSCHLFNVAGAGLQWQSPPPSIENSATFSGWQPTGFFGLTGVATPSGNVACYVQTNPAECAELIVFLYLAENKNLCLKINNNLNITNPSNSPPVSNTAGMGHMYTTAGAFTGTYDGSTSFHHVPDIWGEPAGCFQYHATNDYFFYKVLIAR